MRARNTTRRGLRKIAKFHPRPSLDDTPLKPHPLARPGRQEKPEAQDDVLPLPASRAQCRPVQPKPYRIPPLRPARIRVPVADYVCPFTAMPATLNTGRQVLGCAA